ncbi:DUF4342 domain-containing protein [Thermohalobacter berrensis]|uniref:DUF4342 domain-containing protein n=1 Tax=Thermohalobacter berrensis TaxID=99594 RepID=A0A419SUX3_9FIRM|nr:DUF4342 domain-containing protein [Thermohalobacter berrensis]RKD29016.1 hypothetical protein BET03_06630 [Thermohalobacter berrensis]
MSINLEQIDLIRERAKVSYNEAKEALEKCNNDVVEALVYLENKNKIKDKKEDRKKFFNKVKKVIDKGNKMKFTIKKEGKNIIKLPLTIAILITIFATPFVIAGLIIALLTKHSISFEKESGKVIEVNKIFDNMSSSTNDEQNKTE